MLKKREEIPEEYKWDIGKVYSGIEEWEKDFAKLKEIAPKLKGYKGKLNQAKELLDFLKLDEEISRLADKLAVYAFLRADEDTTNTTQQALKNKIETYLAELMAMGSFFTPEILSYEEGTVEREIEELPELKIYEFMLKKILKTKPHTLSSEMEELMASVSDCLNAPGKHFQYVIKCRHDFS
jgi:oligoendopeptidase F